MVALHNPPTPSLSPLTMPRLSHIVHGASFGAPLCVCLIIGPIYVMSNKHDHMYTNLPPGWVDVPFHSAFSSPSLFPFPSPHVPGRDPGYII